MKVKPHHIAESHRLQFDGMDYQRAAHQVNEHVGLSSDNEADCEEFAELESEPTPDCDCGFCATAPWEDNPPGEVPPLPRLSHLTP